jgi:hypothetical protein
MKTFTFLVTLLVSISLLSCKKEGPMGPQGPAGTNGVDGSDGINGNANVKTYTVSITSANWICSGICYADVTCQGITQNIVNTGSVHLFMESPTQAGAWLNMPWTDMYSGYITTYNFAYVLGTLRISKVDSDLTTPSNPGTRKFKIVVIASSGKLAHPEVDYTNFEEIREAFDIVE